MKKKKKKKRTHLLISLAVEVVDAERRFRRPEEEEEGQGKQQQAGGGQPSPPGGEGAGTVAWGKRKILLKIVCEKKKSIRNRLRKRLLFDDNKIKLTPKPGKKEEGKSGRVH